MGESSRKAKENLRIALAHTEKWGELMIMALEHTYYSSDIDWKKARGWALRMMDTIRGLREEFLLDSITQKEMEIVFQLQFCNNLEDQK